MRRSKTLAKIRAGRTVRICNMGHYLPFFVEHAAHFGFDCIWLDAEHRAWEARELQALLAHFHRCDIDCMLRPPTLEKSRLYRYLEDVAAGLMIPHVSTVERARELVQATKFPPLGDRGQDGSGLDNDFYLHGHGDYTDQANRETFLVVQIETPQAVANAEAIAAVEGVDGLFVGPGDLGLRLRHHPDPTLTLDVAYETVAAAAAKHGKAWGCPASGVEELKRFRAMGAQLLAHGGEFFAIMNMLKQTGADFAQIE
ncbi:MAG: 4-hydroxy-2-oxovalerate aldolase [Planctomycetales bacterium]|nr:4-hydroxy-2-oxovalerate aldolase [Planctomycetales bacterium]